MTLQIHPYYVTFGVQYTSDPKWGDTHPLGFHHDGYLVIEAPDFGMAQRMADAIFGNTYSMIYDRQPEERYAPDGELGRIRWEVPTTTREADLRELHHFETEQSLDKVRGVINAEVGWENPAVLIDRIRWALGEAPA